MEGNNTWINSPSYFGYMVYLFMLSKKLCSVIGASVIGMGYYTILYGEFKEEDDEKSSEKSSDSLDKKIPLLQENMQV